MQQQLFPGFQRHDVDVGDGVRIAALVGGSGAPLLLLQGHPQTSVIWHRVAPILAEHHTVVAADLRGYGDSSKPGGEASHANYAKRVMARDQLMLMRHFGFDRFDLLAHAWRRTIPSRWGGWPSWTSRPRSRCTSRPMMLLPEPIGTGSS